MSAELVYDADTCSWTKLLSILFDTVLAFSGKNARSRSRDDHPQWCRVCNVNVLRMKDAK